jgi:hypothetical protein
MIVLYSIVGFAVTYFFLRRAGGVIRHVIILLGAAVVTTLMQAWTLDFLYPFGGYTIDMMNAQIVLAAGAFWPAMAGPLLGTIVAKFARDKRTDQPVG